MKTWWDIILEKRPGYEKYPASLAKTTVQAAEAGDEAAQMWMKQQGLWYSEFDVTASLTDVL
jgi:hypothetical protein